MTTLAPIDAYRLLAPTYDEMPNPLLSLEQWNTAALLPPLAGLTVADVAAGTGRWARYCKRRGAFVVAIDFCREMLEHAPPPRVLGDARLLPLRDACADVTVLSFGLGYAPDCLPELARITRAGGVVIASDIHPEALRLGWKRGFRVGDRSIEAVSKTYDLHAVAPANLRLTRLIEVPFHEKGDETNRAMARAIFVARWEKL